MAEALRRLLWLFPLLGLGSVALFAILSQIPAVRHAQELPTFYNPQPVTAQSETQKALERLLAGDAHAAERLQELGGAALPEILPRLPRLSIKERREVSNALWPIAKRMQIRQTALFLPQAAERAERTDHRDARLLFWQRYYQDHDLDFRPVSVTRIARRLAERSVNLRRADLLALDTYALPFLVDQLGRVTSQEDVERIERLSKAISHASQQDFYLESNASVDQARRLATKIRAYWDDEGAKWTHFDRFETLAARLSQTAFAIWAFRTGRALLGIDSPVLFESIYDAARSSLFLLALGLVGALLVGPAIATGMQLSLFRRSTWQGKQWEPRVALSLLMALLLPGLLVHAPESSLLLGFVALATGGLFSAYLLQRELMDRLDWRSHHVLRTRAPLGRVFAVARWLSPSIPTLAPIVTAEVLVWMTCLEASSPTQGLGSLTLAAYTAGKIDWLMAICLGAGLATAAIQLVADMTLGTARWRRGES